MTDIQKLFLSQARSDFLAFDLLRESGLPRCHCLHYLQMTTELFSKAYSWGKGSVASSHKALVSFFRDLPKNRKAQSLLGFDNQNENWKQAIRKMTPLAGRIEDLAPSLAGDGPNPEYPWPKSEPAFAPADFTFNLWEELESHAGRAFLLRFKILLQSAEQFL